MEHIDFLDAHENFLKEEENATDFLATQVGSAVFFPDPISYSYSINDALILFKNNPDITSVPVEGNYGVIGLLLESDLRNKKMSLFNDLIDKKVDQFIRGTDNNIDAKESIEKVIQILLQGDESILFDDIPVYHHGRFYGVTNFLHLSRQNNVNRQMDLEQARNLQQFLMEKSKIQDIGCSIEIYNKMAHSLGGDFYKILKLNDSLSLISSYDVAGKGIAGSLSTAIISSFFTTIEVAEALEDFSPGQLVKLLNATIFSQTPPDVYVTAIFVFIDQDAEQYMIYNCGHTPLWVIDTETGNLEVFDPTAPPLGIMDELPDMESLLTTIPLNNLKQLFIYSDGLLDIRNIDGKEFGEDGLKRILTGEPRPIQELIPEVGPAIEKFIGKAPQTDDVTIIALQYEGATKSEKQFSRKYIETAKKITSIQSGYTAVIGLTIYRPKVDKTIYFAKYYYHQGRFLIVILKPTDQIYNSYLYDGTQLLLILPDGTENELPVDSKILNSDISPAQLIPIGEYQKSEMPGLVQMDPDNPDLVFCELFTEWDQVRLSIGKDNFMPAKAEFLNDNESPRLSVEYKTWTGLGDAYLSSHVTITDNTQEGYNTKLEYKNIKPANLADSIFTREFVKKIHDKKED